MYESIITVSLAFKIGSQIMRINVGLDVANELVLNMFTRKANLYIMDKCSTQYYAVARLLSSSFNPRGLWGFGQASNWTKQQRKNWSQLL